VRDASRLGRWHNAIRSYVLAGRASGLYGRSIKLRRSGKLCQAMETAREGLALLGAPGVRRQEGPEGSGIVCLTIQVEQLAHQLGEEGVGRADLEDAVTFLRSLPQDARGTAAELRQGWLQYLEATAYPRCCADRAGAIEEAAVPIGLQHEDRGRSSGAALVGEAPA
jgi:hypothetical protein